MRAGTHLRIDIEPIPDVPDNLLNKIPGGEHLWRGMNGHCVVLGTSVEQSQQASRVVEISLLQLLCVGQKRILVERAEDVGVYVVLRVVVGPPVAQ